MNGRAKHIRLSVCVCAILVQASPTSASLRLPGERATKVTKENFVEGRAVSCLLNHSRVVRAVSIGTGHTVQAGVDNSGKRTGESK